MTQFYFLEIDLFAITLLLIIFWSSRASSPHLAVSRRFRLIVILTVCVLICDISGWLLIGQFFTGARDLLWIVNIFYFWLSGSIAFLWLTFVLLRILPQRYISPIAWFFISVPLVTLIIVSAASVGTGWLFTIDEGNAYQRGPLFQLQTVVTFGYIIAAAVIAFWRMRREVLREKRIECLWLCLFIVLPVIGGTLEILRYGLLLLWPGVALSQLLVYVNMQSQQISLDTLTGLNNRGHFDRYLLNRCNSYDGHTMLILFLLDIDHFKSINDRFGHVVGDEALVEAAHMLQSVFQEKSAFLARYGGDEFSVILSCHHDSEIEEVLSDLEAAQQQFSKDRDSLSPSLRFSIGYARYDPMYMESSDQFIAAADQQMYRQKKKRQATAK